MELIAALLDATSGAHTPRTMVRAIASALSPHVPVTYVALGSPPLAAVDARSENAPGEPRSDGWQIVEPHSRAAREVVPGLAWIVRGPVPANINSAEFKRALAAVIAAALRHLEVVQRVAQLSQRAHASARELRSDLDRLGETPAIVARSAVMRDVLARAALVAKHSTTVLITGESGTGKE